MILTEYGDFVIFGSPAILDEWGRRKIDGILEDGTRVIEVIEEAVGQFMTTLKKYW